MTKERFECANDKIVAIEELKPNPKNNNKHPKDQIERLAKIIEKQGQRAPIVVSNLSGYIVKGHGRLEAIKLLGWKNAAVDFQDYGSEDEEYADMTADNQIALWAEFDDESFAKELPNLNIDYDLLGMRNIPDYNITLDNVSKSIPSVQTEEEKPYRIVYELCFNDEIEQEHWYNFLQALKRKFPEVETISERVIAVTDEWVNKNGQ